MKGTHCSPSCWCVWASCSVKQLFTETLNLGARVSVSRCQIHLFIYLYLWTLAWTILGRKDVYFPNTGARGSETYPEYKPIDQIEEESLS